MSTDKRVKTLAVSEETHQQIMTLKLRMRARAVEDVIRFLMERYSQSESEKKEVKRSEEEIAKIASDLIYKTCVNLGGEARFLPPFIYKRFKIQDKDIVEYFDRIRDKEIVCSEVLKRREEEIARIVSDLVHKACVDLGIEAKFYIPLIIKRYKIQDKDIVDYVERIRDRVIDCSQVLGSS